MRTLVVGFVLVLAGVASAQDGGLAQYRLGAQLLTDRRFPKPKDRQVYAVEGHPELSISLLGPEHPTREQLDGALAKLRQRQADLERLAEAGVPVLRVLDVGVIDGRPAYLHRTMATGTAEPNWITERGPILSDTTKKSMDEAKAKLAKAGIGVKEAELWFDAKGRVFVDAPSGVVTAAESGPWSSFYLRQTAGSLDSVKGLADISIAYRKKQALADGLPEIAAEVVRSVARDLQALEFWRTDKAPAEVVSRDPARTAHDRGFERPSESAGLLGALGERVRAASDPTVEDAGR